MRTHSALQARARYKDQFQDTPAVTAAKSYWDRISQYRYGVQHPMGPLAGSCTSGWPGHTLLCC